MVMSANAFSNPEVLSRFEGGLVLALKGDLDLDFLEGMVLFHGKDTGDVSIVKDMY